MFYIMSGIKAAAYLNLNFFAHILYVRELFCRTLFCRTDVLGFLYFVYIGCYNYQIITALNNYHVSITLHTNILLKKVKGVLVVKVLLLDSRR